MAEIKVHFVTGTMRSMSTLWILWEASRNQKPTEEILNTAARAMDNPESQQEKRELLLRIVESDIPVAENVSFTFLLDNVPVALREQLVRHRVGAQVGPNFGVDVIPELASSSFWAQSMRVIDMGHFVQENRFHVPESVATNEEAARIYFGALRELETAYQELTGLNVPLEDARGIIPLAATHRISWTLNLATLSRIVRKRGCWILQLGFWGPVIHGMISELARLVDPVFHELIQPPCVKRLEDGGRCFERCHFCLDNEQRLEGKDPLPPCPLWAKFEHCRDATRPLDWLYAYGRAEDGGRTHRHYGEMALRYGPLWGFDPLNPGFGRR